MRYSLASVGVWGALFVGIGWAGAQPAQLPEPLVAQSFDQEQDAQSWLGVGDNAKVWTERAAENVKVGTGSLRFEYQVAPKQSNMLVSTMAPGSLATLRSISFWIKADHNASFIFALQEQGGGRFGTTFSVAKDQWQRVEIAPEELVLQTDQDAPKDADGKLDVTKIEGVALIDFGQFLAGLAADPQNPVARMLGIQTGPHTVFVDDLIYSSKPLATEKATTAVLDALDHPQADWAIVGDAALKIVRGDGTAPNTLQASYTQTPGKVMAIAKLLAPGVLTNKDSLAFSIASKQHAMLLVQLEERGGGKYNTLCDVDANENLTPHRLAFTAFNPADDSKDDNNHLDLDQVKQLLVIDVTGMLGGEGAENTLRLSPIRVD